MTCDLQWELGEIVGKENATPEMNEELSNGRGEADDEERTN